MKQRDLGVMTHLRLHQPDADVEPEPEPAVAHVPAPPPKPRPPQPARGNAPKCARCGKRARWPLGEPDPLFCTRLCGYLIAVDLCRARAPGTR